MLSYDEARDPADRLIDWYLHYLIVPTEEPIPVETGSSVNVVIDYAAGAPLGQVQVSASPG